MYRLYTEEMDPLVASDVILKEYSRNDITSLHEENLFELGEDRMLTTLLLQNFAGISLQFVPEAVHPIESTPTLDQLNSSQHVRTSEGQDNVWDILLLDEDGVHGVLLSFRRIPLNREQDEPSVDPNLAP
jgi:hypothetical protein